MEMNKFNLFVGKLSNWNMLHCILYYIINNYKISIISNAKIAFSNTPSGRQNFITPISPN